MWTIRIREYKKFNFNERRRNLHRKVKMKEVGVGVIPCELPLKLSDVRLAASTDHVCLYIIVVFNIGRFD